MGAIAAKFRQRVNTNTPPTGLPSLAEDEKGALVVISRPSQPPRTKTRHRYADDRKPKWVGYDGSSVWWDPKTNPLDDLIVKSTQTPDGQYIYTLDANSVIHVWNVDKGQDLLNNQAVVYHRAEGVVLVQHRCNMFNDVLM